MNPIRDLTNQRFGRLTAIQPTKNRSKSGNVIWLCKCDCGNFSEVANKSLLSGLTKSCGCLRRKRTIERNLKHGDASRGTKPRLYNIWTDMKARCLSLNLPQYKYYGKRGITICEQWKNNYLAFKWWAMSHGYADDLTIDRINHKGNYEPNNCQWLTRSENSIKANKERKKGKNHV